MKKSRPRVLKSVDDYLAGVPEPARSTLKKLRAQVRALLPSGALEQISYGMPGYKYRGTVLWFAAFSDHCSLFPTAGAVAALKSELRGFKTSKGTIRFAADRPLPAALVKKIVKFRLAQLEKKRS